MQTLSAQAAFGAAAASRRQQRRQGAAARRGGLVVRADVGFCRDKISEPKDMKGLIDGTSTIVFLGANGEEIPVECPKVGPRCRFPHCLARRRCVACQAPGGMPASLCFWCKPWCASQSVPACVPRQGEYILNAGLEAGLELPFTCKGGICGCCVGRVAEGEIDQSDVRRAGGGRRAGPVLPPRPAAASATCRICSSPFAAKVAGGRSAGLQPAVAIQTGLVGWPADCRPVLCADGRGGGQRHLHAVHGAPCQRRRAR